MNYWCFQLTVIIGMRVECIGLHTTAEHREFTLRKLKHDDQSCLTRRVFQFLFVFVYIWDTNNCFLYQYFIVVCFAATGCDYCSWCCFVLSYYNILISCCSISCRPFRYIIFFTFVLRIIFHLFLLFCVFNIFAYC